MGKVLGRNTEGMGMGWGTDLHQYKTMSSFNCRIKD